jgi:myo-inositol 2-dehydrogenase/D-chiro-inositol 1-dehydrogenase
MAQAENQRAADIVVADAAGFAKPVLLDFFMTRYLEAYAAEIAAFIAAVTEGVPPEVTGADGLAALELADAAARAAKSGAWVSL